MKLSGQLWGCTIMNGPTVLSKKSKREIVKEFIERVNPYEPAVPNYKMDLRAYADYVKKNGLTGKDITQEIMNMFISH